VHHGPDRDLEREERPGVAKTEVLIVGAGPTGLVLALWLAKSGVALRIIDKTDAPGTTSRAILFHARNLEFYHQLGIADVAVERGVQFAVVNLWKNGRHVGRVSLADIGAGISPYPYILILPQDQQEQLLIEQLDLLGVRVERQTELVSLHQTPKGVSARLKARDGNEEIIEAEYLAGCDGAHSFVRETINVDFPGGAYDDLYYVADVEAEGPVTNGEMHGAIDDAEFLAIFPMKGQGRIRFVGQAGPDARRGPELRWENESGRAIERLKVTVKTVRWFSTYHVGHRVAGAFRRGRVFLLGDAAHIHSPVGGQGMNTGIGDAVNLAWKLAAVLEGRAGAAILDSYAVERRAFARTLVRTTDRAFKFVSARGPIAKWLRLTIVPRIVPRLFEFRATRALLFRTISQTSVRYPQSLLSSGKGRRIRGGDRLPWITIGKPSDRAGDNFDPLVSRDWQAHVYGKISLALRAFCESRGLPTHVFPWRSEMRGAGFQQDATYLIRPDGYVGSACRAGNVAELERYLDRHQIRMTAK